MDISNMDNKDDYDAYEERARKLMEGTKPVRNWRRAEVILAAGATLAGAVGIAALVVPSSTWSAMADWFSRCF